MSAGKKQPMSEAASVPTPRTDLFERADSLRAPLNERLELYGGESRKLSPELEAAYDALVARIKEGGAGAGVPDVGDTLPDAVLTDADACSVQLSSYLDRGPLVISFNRGPWCDYCGLELRALARAYPYIVSAGGDVVSIVPELAPFGQALQRKHSLPFAVLSDLDLAYCLSLGLAFWVGETVKGMYQEIGLDLERFQGSGGWLLPIPATLVVGREGEVVARFVDTDFRRRMTTEEVLAAVSEAAR
jgi:peroxiredoxin